MTCLYVVVNYMIFTLYIGMMFYEKVIKLAFKNKYWSTLFGIIYWYIAVFILIISLFKLIFVKKKDEK